MKKPTAPRKPNKYGGEPQKTITKEAYLCHNEELNYYLLDQEEQARYEAAAKEWDDWYDYANSLEDNPKAWWFEERETDRMSFSIMNCIKNLLGTENFEVYMDIDRDGYKIGWSVVYSDDNPNYEEELKKYNNRFKTYEKDRAEYEKQLEEYKIWKAQEDIRKAEENYLKLKYKEWYE